MQNMTLELRNKKLFLDKHNEKLFKKKTNKIKTTMYNKFTFIPLALFNQLKKFTNIFFIAKSSLSLFPQLSSINPLSLWIPVIYIIFFSMCFDWYQDIKRYLADKKVNNRKVKIIRNGVFKMVKAKNIKIGDLMILEENDIVMVDLVLLTYKNDINYCYIDTSTLDGEKTLKPKLSVFDANINLSVFIENKKDNLVSFPNIKINLNENEANLYKFFAKFEYTKKEKKISTDANKKEEYSKEILKKNNYEKFSENIFKKNLDINNFIPRSSIIRNSHQVVGLVVYLGHDTKLMKNTQKRIFKMSKIEKDTNFYIFLVVCIFMILILILCIISLFKNRDFNFAEKILKYKVTENNNEFVNFAYTFLGYFLLCNGIVPITLVVTLQFIKLIQNGFFLIDDEYKEKSNKKKCAIKTFNISDDLGQIQYILSDKTGTLTQNKMVAKYFQIGDYQKTLYIENKLKNGKNINSDEDKLLKFDFQEENLLITNFKEDKMNSNFEIKNSHFEKIKLESNDKKDFFSINSQKELNEIFYFNINTCHDCFSKTELDKKNLIYQNNKLNLQYEGSSPDEIALLKGSRDYCDFLLKDTTIKETDILTKNNGLVKIKKLHTFQFDSNRKMMSVIIEKNGKIFQMLKGADNSLLEKSSTNLSENFLNKYDFYLDLGYRMMFLGIRLISKEEFKKYEQEIIQNNLSEEELDKIKKDFENNITIIGATAIEDKLQEGVKDTIVCLKKAGIKIWVITGDKTETALNIAKSANLIERNEDPILIDNEENLKLTLKNHDLNKNQKQNKNNILEIEKDPPMDYPNSSFPQENEENFLKKKDSIIISGKILTKALINHREKFRDILLQKKSIVFSRTNANQKVEIVKLLKEIGIRTLAIGDGANDVNMIQEATVGVGIIGEEGKQAENASDFSVPRFMFLKPLVLHHGRITYYRISQLILVFYYKSFIHTMPQIFFAFSNDFSRQNFFNDFYALFYLMLFTVFNLSTKSVTDLDIDRRAVYYKKNFILESSLYFLGLRNKLFSLKKFIFWIIISVLESAYIYYMAYFLLGETIYYNNHTSGYLMFSIFTFTMLIVYQNIKILYLTFNFDVINSFGLFLSFFAYFIYLFATDKNKIIGYYLTVSKSFYIFTFYIYFFLILFSLLFFHHTFYILKRYIFPSIKDHIRAMKSEIEEIRLEKKLTRWKFNDEKKNFINYIFR